MADEVRLIDADALKVILNKVEEESEAQGHHSHEVNTLFVFADYEPADNCVNPDSYGMICVKCGQCGRKFGVEVDEE